MTEEISFTNNAAEFDQGLAAALEYLRTCEAFFAVILPEDGLPMVVGGSRATPTRASAAYFVAIPELLSVTRAVADQIVDEDSRARAHRDIDKWIPDWLK